MEIFSIEPPIDPEQVIKIEEMVRKSGWLLTTFSFLGDNQYILPTYLFNENLIFRVLHDINFISELISTLKVAQAGNNQRLSNDQKIVTAHQAFFQLANITSEPNLAYYEYADKNEFNNVTEELDVFRIADNLNVQHWADMALGRKVLLSDSDFMPIKGT